VNRRPAQTVHELEAWVGSAEGQKALAYDRAPDGKIIPSLDEGAA
jgi:hypothetical protein